MDPYNTLKIHRDASQEEIKAAYKKRARETHPDQPGGDGEDFKDVKVAYDQLTCKAETPGHNALYQEALLYLSNEINSFLTSRVGRLKENPDLITEVIEKKIQREIKATKKEIKSFRVQEEAIRARMASFRKLDNNPNSDLIALWGERFEQEKKHKRQAYANNLRFLRKVLQVIREHKDNHFVLQTVTKADPFFARYSTTCTGSTTSNTTVWHR